MVNKNKDEEAIFNKAVEFESSDERDAYIAEACGDDSKLRAAVEALLKAHFEADNSFLTAPPGIEATLDNEVLSEGPGTRIGRYKLLEMIGEGGFGVVYMAEQEKPIRRRVALKIIKLGMDTKQVIARFEAERQALAMMEHPNIAKVLDAGATDTGRPYFVMELVKGIPITEYCDKNNLDTRQRLELFVELCKAVQHAHQKGIIHRDIKPSNVMITLRDGKPVPKIIDFGIAKATQGRLTEKTFFTKFKQFIGTPEYMSPEQAELSELDVDTRTDIYSLGVVLYELLTSTTPFEAEELHSAAYDEMLKIIRETDPPKPSTRLNTLGDMLSEVARHRHVEPGQLCKIVHGELDWIVMKTLEKDRTRRYETANELAMDIERHLGDEPVVAGPPSVGYRLRKFVRRNRTAVAVGLVVLASLVVGLALATVGFVQASHERDRAFAAEVVARSAEGVARSSEAEAVAQRQIAENQQNLAEERELTTRRHLYTAHIYLAHQAWEIGYVERALELLDAYIPKAGEEELRSFGWYYLWRLCHGDLFSLPQSGTVHATFSPDGQTIATVGNYDRTVKLWDATSGQLQATLGTTAAWSIAFSPDGSTLATGGHNSGEIKLWNVASRTEQALLHGDPSGTMCLAFSPDGRMLAASSGHWDRKGIDGAVHVWDVATGQRLAILRGHTMGVPIVAFAPEGKTLASGSWDGFVKLWDTATWKELITFETIPVIAFSPDGTILATLDGPGQPTVKLRNPVTGHVVAELEKGTRSLVSLAFSPDGGTLAGASLQPCAIDIWDVASGQLRNVIRGHTHWVWSVSFSPDGKRLVTGSRDGTAKVWELPHRPENLLRSHTHKWTVFWGPIGRHVFDFSPDGRTLVIPGKGDTADLWDVASRTRLASFDGHGQPVTSVAFSADGNVLATGGLDGAVKLWDMATKRESVNLEPGEGHVAVSDLEFSPDGTVLAAARSRNVLLIDVATGREHARLAPHTTEVSSLAFSPDGRTLATTCLITCPGFGSVNLWDTATGKHKARYGPWPNDLDRLLDVAFSADGKVLALGGGGGFNPIQAGSTKLVDVATGREIGRLKGHSDYVTSTAFSPDGKTLATASFDSTVKLWDTFTWQEQMTLKCKGHQIDCIEFSPDGKVLVVGTVDGTVQLFCAAREEDVATRAEEIRARRLTLWSSQKRWDELVDEYSKMIIDNPDDAGLFYQRARAYLEMEKWEEAIADFSKAIELAATCPTDPESRRRLAQTYRSLADVLEKMGRSEDAQQANQKAEEIEKAPIKE